MPNIDDKQLAIATVYARSILELAENQGVTDSLIAEFEQLVSALASNEELAGFFSSPLIDSDKRAASLEKMFRGKASDLLVDSLQVINRKDRLEMLPTIVTALHQERQALRGVVDVEVATAVPLTAALRDRLRRAVDRFTGQKSRLVEVVDPQLVGGMMLRLGDQKIDSSVARELEKMHETLAHRTSHEILRARRTSVDSRA